MVFSAGALSPSVLSECVSMSLVPLRGESSESVPAKIPYRLHLYLYKSESESVPAKTSYQLHLLCIRKSEYVYDIATFAL